MDRSTHSLYSLVAGEGAGFRDAHVPYVASHRSRHLTINYRDGKKECFN